MSTLDLFAWIVLIVLVVTTVAMLLFLAMLPGIVARRRGHPWTQAVTVAGWITLIFAFPLWPVAMIWAYVDVPARREHVEDREQEDDPQSDPPGFAWPCPLRHDSHHGQHKEVDGTDPEREGDHLVGECRSAPHLELSGRRACQ